MSPREVQPHAGSDELRAAAELEALLAQLATETRRAGEALEQGDLDQIMIHLDERDHLLSHSEALFDALRRAESRAGEPGNDRPPGAVAEAIGRSARSATEEDALFLLALGACREELRAEIERVDETRSKSSNYRVPGGEAGRTLDLTT